MVKIVIENRGQKVVVVDPSQSILKQFQEQGIDWMQDCGGKGRCTTCAAMVISGGSGLSTLTPAENKYRAIGALGSNERLMCQARTSTDVVVRVPKAYQLPHVLYD